MQSDDFNHPVGGGAGREEADVCPAFVMPEIVGYCRVSTDGQTLDAQIPELKAAGATKLFAEKQSGARSDRPQLRKAIAALG
jgi:hypothetical protein